MFNISQVALFICRRGNADLQFLIDIISLFKQPLSLNPKPLTKQFTGLFCSAEHLEREKVVTVSPCYFSLFNNLSTYKPKPYFPNDLEILE